MILTIGKLTATLNMIELELTLLIAFRYKMPLMILKQESRLNGVKTNITNLPEVARALRVPESAILKYF